MRVEGGDAMEGARGPADQPKQATHKLKLCSRTGGFPAPRRRTAATLLARGRAGREGGREGGRHALWASEGVDGSTIAMRRRGDEATAAVAAADDGGGDGAAITWQSTDVGEREVREHSMAEA